MAKAAKKAPAPDAAAAPEKKGPSLVVQIGLLLVLTGAAIGMGWFSGAYLNGQRPEAAAETAPASEAHAAKPADDGHGGGHGEPAKDEAADGAHIEHNPMVVALPPLTTNLAAPVDTWVRLEASIVVNQPPSAELPDAVHQDLLAFIRTLKLHQIEGASGFQHFKADLEERAAIRSEGHVKSVLIRTLLFE